MIDTITGSYSVGKSTLTSLIEKKTEGERRLVIPDVARWWLRSKGINSNDMKDSERNDLQLFVIGSYTGAVKNAVKHSIYSILDGSHIEAKAYSQGVVSEQIMKMLDRQLEQYKKYVTAYVIPPTIALENDGLRHTNKEFRVEIHRRIMQIIDQFEIPHHILISQTPEERLEEFMEKSLTTRK